MQLTAYLNFPGTCEAAFRFYESTLRGKIVMMTNHGDSPAAAHTPPEWHTAILHARLEVGGAVLMGSDAPGDYFKQPQGFGVSLSVESPDEAERIFSALADGGATTMPMSETFWATRFGMCTDRFGTPWLVNCDRPSAT